MPPGGRLRYAPGLDGVRALAVLSVFVYHLGVTSTGEHFLSGGFIGVDVFFVLSGYLITSLLLVELGSSGRISIKTFYVRRARRLLPAVFALLLVVALIGAFWLPQQAARLRGDLAASFAYVTNWWLIAQESSYFGTGERPPLLNHLWSLAVEEQFYLIWPLILVLLATRRTGRILLLVLLPLAIIGSVVWAGMLYDPFVDPSRVYYGTDTRAATPLLGALLAVWLRPWRQRKSTSPVLIDLIGLASIAGLGYIAWRLHDRDSLLYQGGFLVIALLAGGLVVAAGHPATRLGELLGKQPLRWLGERSYAIYLWHWPVCVMTRPLIDVPLTGWANSALRLGITLALAELSYWLVERPIRQGNVFRWTPLSRQRDLEPALALAAGPVVAPVMPEVSGALRSPSGAQTGVIPAMRGPSGAHPIVAKVPAPSQPGRHSHTAELWSGDSPTLTFAAQALLPGGNPARNPAGHASHGHHSAGEPAWHNDAAPGPGGAHSAGQDAYSAGSGGFGGAIGAHSAGLGGFGAGPGGFGAGPGGFGGTIGAHSAGPVGDARPAGRGRHRAPDPDEADAVVPSVPPLPSIPPMPGAHSVPGAHSDPGAHAQPGVHAQPGPAHASQDPSDSVPRWPVAAGGLPPAHAAKVAHAATPQHSGTPQHFGTPQHSGMPQRPGMPPPPGAARPVSAPPHGRGPSRSSVRRHRVFTAVTTVFLVLVSAGVVARLNLAAEQAVFVMGEGPIDPAPDVNLDVEVLPPAGVPREVPVKVSIFGDSQGKALYTNRPADIGKYLKLTDESISACGILPGKVRSRSGEGFDLQASCPRWLSEWERDANRVKPDIALVVIGAWDVFDLHTDGGKLVFGTPEWDDVFRSQLHMGITALRSSGATVALALLPCYSPIRGGSAGYWPERGDAERTAHVNDLLREATTDHVYTVESAGEFCSDPEIATSRKYRWDGLHYLKAGSAVYFNAMVPQLLTLPA